MKVWICSNCKTPIEPMFVEASYGEGSGTGFRCPGSADGCSPHKSRELLTPEQVEAVDVRERLTEGETCRAASEGQGKAHLAWLGGPEENVTAKVTDEWAKAGLEAAFDHTFPEVEGTTSEQGGAQSGS